MVGIFDTKSFALSAWNAPTVITGLTAEPLSVDGDFARTYDSNRHNFFECVLITPESDPSLPESQRTELRDSNVKSILVEAWTSSGTPQIQSIRILGFDDSLRQLE